MRIIKKIKKLLLCFIDILFPKKCLGCRQEGEWLCQNCFLKIPTNKSQICIVCHSKTKQGEVCKNCISKSFLDGVVVISDYNNELLQEAIHSLKYKYVVELAKKFGSLFKIFLQKNELQVPSFFMPGHEAFLISVPLHKKRWIKLLT